MILCNVFISPDHGLVRVLHNQILAILLGHHQVKDTSERGNHEKYKQKLVRSLNHQPDDTPCVVHAKVDLLAKLDGFELLRSKDHVPRAVFHIVPGDVAKLEVVRPRQDALDCPLGQLASVVLQLVGKDSSALGVQLLPPVHAAAVPGIPLIQGFQVHKLNLTAGALIWSCMIFSRLIIKYLLYSVQFATADQVDIISKIPP